MDLLEKKARLIAAVAGIGVVRAIGQTGDIDEVPRPGKGDIDLFVFCDEVPHEAARSAAYQACGEAFSECCLTTAQGGHWGTIDMLLLDGVETYFMYFTVEEMRCYLSDVLAGRYPEKDGGFYPTGRLATLRTIHGLYDEMGTLAALKAMTEQYPEALSGVLFRHHFARILDEEDFGRAVLRRDVLFYHMVLEESLDHFLQALYALNKTYFPSRKRTRQYMAGFKHMPQDCYARMLRVIEDGSREAGIAASYEQWRKLVDELGGIAVRQ